QARVRPHPVDRIGDRVEDGDALDVLTALAGRDAGDEVRAVRTVAQPVETSLAAGEPLDDEPRVVVDDDRHYFVPFRMSVGRGIQPSTARSPSSSRTRAASSPVHSTRASNGSISSGRVKWRSSAISSPASSKK